MRTKMFSESSNNYIKLASFGALYGFANEGSSLNQELLKKVEHVKDFGVELEPIDVGQSCIQR